MAARKVRGIIFDIGRVLVRIDVSRALQSLATGRALSGEALWSAIEKDPRWKDWQEGRISARDWHLHMKQRFGGNATFDEFTQAWNLVLHPDPILDKDLFERLAKRYRLALLSNTDPIHVAYMETRYDFFAYFPVRIYSCAVGTSKPDPLIYREALRACQVRAEQAVYVDDVLSNVQAAERLGMAGIQFQSRQQLAIDFERLGIEI